MNNANIDDFALDSRSLAGSLQARLNAGREAGFAKIMLCAPDLIEHPDGVDAAVAAVLASGLRVTGFTAAMHFEGLTGAMHAYKLDMARVMLGMCHALQGRLLVLPASTLTTDTTDTQALVRDLRQLAMLAIPLNIKIAYQGHAAATLVKDYLQAWDLVCSADMPNLGLCLDSHDVLMANTSAEDLQADLEMLDPERVFLVQLADLLDSPEQTLRVLPGDGEHRDTLTTIVSSLHALGYRGDYSLAAYNADYAAMPAPHVAQRAKTSALWLGQDVLQRSVPLPNQIRLRRGLSNPSLASAR